MFSLYTVYFLFMNSKSRIKLFRLIRKEELSPFTSFCYVYIKYSLKTKNTTYPPCSFIRDFRVSRF